MHWWYRTSRSIGRSALVLLVHWGCIGVFLLRGGSHAFQRSHAMRRCRVGQRRGGRALGGFRRAGSAVGGRTSRKRKPLFNRKCPSTKSEIAAERTPADAREGRLWRISRREPPSVARSGGVLRPARCAAHATASWARKVRADVEDAGALARRRRWAGQKGLLMPSWRLCALVQLVGGLFCAVLVPYRSSVCSRCVLSVASGVAVRDSTASAWFGRRSEGRSA